MAGQNQDANVTPPWGAFPAEQYLIRHWDVSSALSATEQRRSLIRAFLDLDAIPRDWDATGRIRTATTAAAIARVPTRREVADILAPWRPLRWREAALRLWRDRDDEEVWLRTHYGGGSDDSFAGFREVDEDSDPAFAEDCRAWTVLDDRALFDGDWSAALDVLPELVGPTSGYEAHSQRHTGDPERLEALRGGLRESVASALRLEGQGNSAGQLEIDAVEASPAGLRLQASVVASFLFVADAEAFETAKLRLLFLDARGNIVRQSRVPSTDTWEMRDGWNARKFQDGNFWMDRDRSEWHVANDPGSVLGERYRLSGDIGSRLYHLG
ncbi:hypothetical protein SAMD00023353_10200170 [Rosellinia necatrix]|uniref:Uncharacterized protein n=1 Tax=Rosellinia necatrix TaxID=77044 RepID=A0A1W2TWH8_ROSNE|nr:hypothetical protein SAMD00023353_10200170 [Rosellinia necatrix]